MNYDALQTKYIEALITRIWSGDYEQIERLERLLRVKHGEPLTGPASEPGLAGPPAPPPHEDGQEGGEALQAAPAAQVRSTPEPPAEPPTLAETPPATPDAPIGAPLPKALTTGVYARGPLIGLQPTVDKADEKPRCPDCGRLSKSEGRSCRSCTMKKSWANRKPNTRTKSDGLIGDNARLKQLPVPTPRPQAIVEVKAPPAPETPCSCAEQRAVIEKGDWHEADCPWHAHRFPLPPAAGLDGQEHEMRCVCGEVRTYRPWTPDAKKNGSAPETVGVEA